MAEGTIRNIRETSRNFLELNRRRLRDEDADCRRFINNNSGIDAGTVRDIVNKLKTRTPTTVSELKLLKNALADDNSHMDLVFTTHGAIRGLARDISGNDVQKQIAATGCLCNLGLADSKGCIVISKTAGPYLVANLDSMTELSVISAWTLGNLAGSGTKTCEVLTAQGAIAKLIDVATRSSNDEAREAAIYAIEKFAHYMADDFKPEYLHKTLEIIPDFDIETTARLQFILSCHEDFSEYYLTEAYLFKLIHYIKENIEKPCEHEMVMYLFRTLANVQSVEIYDVVLTSFLKYNLADSIRNLLENDAMSESVLWFLGNAFKVRKEHDFFDSD